jgi:tRNA dimethylallyltransferase
LFRDSSFYFIDNKGFLSGMGLIKASSGQVLVAIVGPTAVGKTDLVLHLSEELGAEVINVDSMQVYRYMDIGTAKPTSKEMEKVRHHLIDIVDPDDEYNVSRFVKDADQACQDILSRGCLPILTGGTGLYLKGFEKGLFDIFPEKSGDGQGKIRSREKLQELLIERGQEYLFTRLEECDPVSAARIHPNDTSRLLRALEIFEETGVPWSVHLARQQDMANKNSPNRRILKIGLYLDREILYERIDLRTAKMFDMGLPEEVQGLLDRGYGPELKSMQSIGYRHVANYLTGEWSREEALRIMARDTRHYAKRQYTWFKKDHEINWLGPDRKNDIFEIIKNFLEREQ